jgi:hypothetical protein
MWYNENMNEHISIPCLENNNGVTRLFRAVSADEFYSVMESKQFALPPDKSTSVKYFGVDYNETVEFADKIQLIDIVAIVEVGISHEILLQIGDFTHVDAYLFKSGTVIIQSENLDEFNNIVKYIEHKL